ncbi:LicD family protein [Enterococcus sp. AZ109]|uniref:LicD family protein n=1 Tax=Enterococcus sp. AZ109 TaxID=2774634 RepID=UPI003F1F0C76
MYSDDLQLRKIQENVLDMAVKVVDFCEDNDLLCYFCGGGVIGSVREKGFIPWDDDLDFFMPRKDYELFFDLWKKSSINERYPILKADVNYIDHNLFTTIRDSNTTFIKTYQKDLDIPHGIAIDIFPLDKAPKSKVKQKIQKSWAMIYSLYCNQIVPKNHGKLISFGSTVLLGVVPSKRMRYSIWKYAEKKMTKYNNCDSEFVTELCVGPRYMGSIYRAEDFEKSIYVDFEDIQMPIPIGYDRYLRKTFGDYMQRPPMSKRCSNHDAVFINPYRPYVNYKGIYYLKEEEGKE